VRTRDRSVGLIIPIVIFIGPVILARAIFCIVILNCVLLFFFFFFFFLFFFFFFSSLFFCFSPRAMPCGAALSARPWHYWQTYFLSSISFKSFLFFLCRGDH
jgi:hypothetical protein